MHIYLIKSSIRSNDSSHSIFIELYCSDSYFRYFCTLFGERSVQTHFTLVHFIQTNHQICYINVYRPKKRNRIYSLESNKRETRRRKKRITSCKQINQYPVENAWKMVYVKMHCIDSIESGHHYSCITTLYFLRLSKKFTWNSAKQCIVYRNWKLFPFFLLLIAVLGRL